MGQGDRRSHSLGLGLGIQSRLREAERGDCGKQWGVRGDTVEKSDHTGGAQWG